MYKVSAVSTRVESEQLGQAIFYRSNDPTHNLRIKSKPPVNYPQKVWEKGHDHVIRVRLLTF